MILTIRCAGCGQRGAVLCRTCRFALVSRPPVPASGGVVVASAYTGRVRDVLLGCKYHNRRAVTGHVGGILAQRLLEHGVGPEHVDVVTWAPTSAARRQRRGFDQAELLARSVAAHLGVPCRRLLERGRSAAGQTGRPRRERLDAATAPRFLAHPRAAGRRVLVVDDVVTTGATLDAAVRALEGAGAQAVMPAAVAATPGCPVAVGRVA